MKVLVIGSGGREHALAWSLARSPRADEVWCAPGNAGIARDVKTAPLDVAGPEGLDAAVRFAREKGIDLTVVGPEAPLVAGIVDRFEADGLRVFGPSRGAAELEGSKCFTKEFLSRHGIPTAAFHIFDSASAAHAHLERVSFPVVLKADGLAAGKGVIIAQDRDEARDAVEAIMVERRFGDAGDRLVVEDFMPGVELTVIALTDGETVVPLETAQDYKPALDGHRGPNTGGMGSYSPHVARDSELVRTILDNVVHPTLAGLRAEGRPYRGALYAGLMLTPDGPSVLEYNVRFGDPETQAILVRLQSDLVEIMEACIEGRLDRCEVEWDAQHAVCVVAASRGYPGSYEKGKRIRGLDQAESLDGVKIFSAGVGADDQGELITAGGRVLGVTALGSSRDAARATAYAALEKVEFDGKTARTDIGVATGEIPG